MWEDITFSYSAIIKTNNILEFANNDYFYRHDITHDVSSKGCQINSHITDIFKVADEIEKVAKENNHYALFQKQIKLIQISSVLQRINEIIYWNIDENTKNKLISKMYYLMKEKYGNPQNVNKAILSVKADLNQIPITNENIITDKEFFETISINKTLDFF